MTAQRLIPTAASKNAACSSSSHTTATPNLRARTAWERQAKRWTPAPSRRKRSETRPPGPNEALPQP
jgi:hypothetical protein